MSNICNGQKHVKTPLSTEAQCFVCEAHATVLSGMLDT
jgi:hypothetical protein